MNGTDIWAILATFLVGFHLVSEYVHYLMEYFGGRKDKKALEEILAYRKKSRKTDMLIQLIKEVESIKKFLLKDHKKPLVLYRHKSGGMRYCCSCDLFHKGVKVNHSHCDSHKNGSLKNYILEHHGRIPACQYWRRDERKNEVRETHFEEGKENELSH